MPEEITEENFSKYFHDVRVSRPEKGQIMARYRTTAELVEGNEKRNLIDLLMRTNKALAATQVMRKLFLASEEDSRRIPIQIAEDLLAGMTAEEVMKKPYPFLMEAFFYVKPEYVPVDDPHWTPISIENLDEFVEKMEGGEIRTKIIK